MSSRLLLIAVLFASTSACGDSGGMDASIMDSAVPSDVGDGTDAVSDSAVQSACSTVGDTRTAPCGNCGVASERCSESLVWEAVSACLEEGVCSPAAVETRPTALCGEETRLCRDTCDWTSWSVTDADGECEPGALRRGETGCAAGTARAETCSVGCAWEVDSGAECVDECGGVPRVSPLEAEEVCIPAGDFVRGDDTLTTSHSSPVATVYVSSYYIDKFPVTNDRYRSCVAAGACTVPRQPEGAVFYADSGRARFSVQGVSYDQATEFCVWDGGRGLPTEAQWEKAARGPAPRAQQWTWDGAGYRCDLLWAAT